MAAVDDLLELVERVGAAERAVLAAKWKDRADVEAMVRTVRHTIEQQRDVERRSGGPTAPSARWARLRGEMLTGDDGATVRGIEPGPASLADAASAESDAKAAVAVARLGILEAHLAVLEARLARLDAGEAEPKRRLPTATCRSSGATR